MHYARVTAGGARLAKRHLGRFKDMPSRHGCTILSLSNDHHVTYPYKTLHEFFSFCGNLVYRTRCNEADRYRPLWKSLRRRPRWLNGGSLDGATLAVTGEKEHREGQFEQMTSPVQPLHDHILQRAIELDISTASVALLNYMKSLDNTSGRSGAAKALDEQKGYSKQATLIVCVAAYYTRASRHRGPDVFQFYTSTEQVSTSARRSASREPGSDQKPADVGTASTGTTEKPLV
ncbi:uncharacterized protein B0H18DRAFT_1033099 [Fomitopsis serialis]|uniref:uncharacterized protein n=1 Tax=Fomitopsis serialis TaxID=139415 RepID=UPI00200894F3|nr:uncharacterized protein B0H18DRAFT_1033099 [Neoantrodia serialis]KAH9917977.1 hypothetical protein B0H18DRAFT_1033099 [Neoantrodia serialis]